MLVIVVFEIVNGVVGRAYSQIISDASNTSVKPFFKKYISKNKKIVTDVWKGYILLKKVYTNMEQMKSEMGKNFPGLHFYI